MGARPHHGWAHLAYLLPMFLLFGIASNIKTSKTRHPRAWLVRRSTTKSWGVGGGTTALGVGDYEETWDWSPANHTSAKNILSSGTFVVHCRISGAGWPMQHPVCQGAWPGTSASVSALISYHRTAWSIRSLPSRLNGLDPLAEMRNPYGTRAIHESGGNEDRAKARGSSGSGGAEQLVSGLPSLPSRTHLAGVSGLIPCGTNCFPLTARKFSVQFIALVAPI